MGEAQHTRRSSRAGATRRSRRSGSGSARAEAAGGTRAEQGAGRMTSVRNIAVAAVEMESEQTGADEGKSGEVAVDSAHSADAPSAGGGRPRARGGTVGRRRAVGPVIGEQLAELLLENHQPDVLLSEQCVCGQPSPCPSRVFATAFLGEEETLPGPSQAALAARATRATTPSPTPPAASDGAVPAGGPQAPATGRHGSSSEPTRRRAAHRADAPRHARGGAVAEPGVAVGAEPPADAVARTAEPDLDSTQVLERVDPDAEPETGSRSGGEAAALPDPDSTQEFQKVPADSPVVRIAV